MVSSKFILRFDDIAPRMAWSKFVPLKKALENLGVKSILGVVPECLDEKLNIENVDERFFDQVREWQTYGDAILQHGTHHLYTTNNSGILKINKNSEFAGYGYREQYELIKKGKLILQKENCWQPYFMAPSHSFDKDTLKALADLGFVAISDGYGFSPYLDHGILHVPQLASKPYKFIPGISTLCIHINRMSGAEIKNLFCFVKANKRSFVDFKSVVNDKSLLGSSPITRVLIGSILKSSRKLRSFTVSRY